MASPTFPQSAGFRCLVCRTCTSEMVYHDCPDYYLGQGRPVDFHRCAGCGLLQQFPLPADATALYEDYPIHARKSRLHGLTRSLVLGPSYYDAHHHPPGTLLLDYGCGDGSYLDRSRGRGLQLLGYETNAAHAAQLAEDLRLPVYADRDAMLAQHAGGIDVVTMHFVLEHVTDLDAAFDTARRLLKPGGTFYYAVPDADSHEARLFGSRWHNLDAPRHISFPGPRAAQLLAERHDFRVVRSAPVPFPNGLAASLPVVLTGRFRFGLFLLLLPLGIVYSRLVPTGIRGYWLVRR
jgi:SAM-dependent methyltransferase